MLKFVPFFKKVGLVYCIPGVVDFWILDLLQLNLDWQKDSKTKVEKAFFLIFMSSFA
jgi:hypothetical protein